MGGVVLDDENGRLVAEVFKNRAPDIMRAVNKAGQLVDALKNIEMACKTAAGYVVIASGVNVGEVARAALDSYRDGEPDQGDYVQILDASGRPSENHVRVSRCTADLFGGVFLVEDENGNSLAIVRLPELDNLNRRAWQEVITSAP